MLMIGFLKKQPFLFNLLFYNMFICLTGIAAEEISLISNPSESRVKQYT